MILIILYLLVYVWMLVSSVWAIVVTKEFLRTTPAISDWQALERFKSIVRLNMWFALILIGCFAIAVVGGFLLVLRYGCLVFTGVLFINAVVIAIGLYLRKLEKRSKNLPAADELAEEYKLISEKWAKKPWPDF